jgi:Fe-S-cluster containining protein
MDLDRLMGELYEGSAAEIDAEEAIALALHFDAEVDRGVAVREEIARRDGIRIACHRGCNGCCEELVLVEEPEALVVARWLARPESAAARERFLAAYPVWRAAVGEDPERLSALVEAGDQGAYDEAHRQNWRRGIRCAFNGDEGECTIHPARPMTCRYGHAVETHERCSGANTGPPAARLAFVPLDDFMKTVKRVLRSAHEAMGNPRHRPEALCIAVHRLLRAG